MNFRIAVAAFAVLLSACQTTESGVPRSTSLEAAGKWNVRCTEDRIRGGRRCFAGTFGRSASGSGIPFQVYYFENEGPFFLVGFHTFPGRYPYVRFDNDANPIRVLNDGGVFADRPQPEILRRMVSASKVRAEFHKWPTGSEQMVVDLAGVDVAVAKLHSLIGR